MKKIKKIRNIKNKTFNLKDYNNIYELQATINYIKAMNNENFEEILNYIFGCEFDVEINEDGTINLIDLLEVYLGGADSYENFVDIFDACERLEGSYLYDYFNICV